MAQESALETNNQHQRQDSVQGTGVEIALASVRRVEFSTKDSVFLPAMSMEVALARHSAIVEFTRQIMVRDQDFGEIPGTNKPTLLKPGAPSSAGLERISMRLGSTEAGLARAIRRMSALRREVEAEVA